METPSKERKTKPAFIECAINQYFGPAGSGATYERDVQRSGWHERVNVYDFFPLVCYLIIVTSAPI